MKNLLAVCFLFLTIGLNSINMPIRLPAIISDHAVLQQSTDVKLWGWGPSTLKILIVGSWSSNDTIKTIVTDSCTWKTTIKTPKAGGPYTIQIFCEKDSLIISDIMIGETWLCSGQSNMEMTCGKNILDAGSQLKGLINNEIRFFHVENSYDIYPHSDCKGKWVVCDSTTVNSFSAIGYFFGSNLQSILKVPVGLINSSWGGTSIQPWMPRTAFENETQRKLENHPGTSFVPQGTSVIYNAMIHPLAPFSLSGVLWYQGETNSLSMKEAKMYGKWLKGLIQSWRSVFETDFPFYYVQIAPFDGYYPKDASAYLREQQERTLSLPKTGIISVGDLVDSIQDIHPRLKASVGKRLANLALKEQYHFSNIQPYSPRFVEMKIEKQKVRVSFSSIGKLSVKGKQINSFNLAGADQTFYPAKATFTKTGEIVLQSKKVSLPVAVRYCFSNEEMPNLFDTNGLPLLPFRTDKW
jgi:sialate O-acetylesterase